MIFLCPTLNIGLSHCGLVTPYVDTNLGQYWLRYWRHQAITSTNVDLSSVKSSDIHLKTIALETSQPPITKISFKMTYLKFYLNLPGANELSYLCHWKRFLVNNTYWQTITPPWSWIGSLACKYLAQLTHCTYNFLFIFKLTHFIEMSNERN